MMYRNNKNTDESIIHLITRSVCHLNKVRLKKITQMKYIKLYIFFRIDILNSTNILIRFFTLIHYRTFELYCY